MGCWDDLRLIASGSFPKNPYLAQVSLISFVEFFRWTQMSRVILLRGPLEKQ